jgi:hypothetical protein
MYPEQNNPQQSKDNQQPYQNQAMPTTQSIDPVQPLAAPQPQYPYQSPNQASKLRPFIIGGATLLISAAVGIFILLNGDRNPQTSQMGNNQNSSVSPQEQAKETTPEQPASKTEITTQNDNKQKNNVTKLVAATSEYASNNYGKIPTTSEINNAFISQYLSGQFNDPITNIPYEIVETDPKPGEIQYKPASTCSSDNNIIAGKKRQVAVRALLSDKTYYCATN